MIDVIVNTDNWSLNDFADFQDLTTNGGSIRVAIPLMTKLIDSWSLPCDPHDTDCVMKGMNLTQWKEVQKVINTSLTEVLNPKE